MRTRTIIALALTTGIIALASACTPPEPSGAPGLDTSHTGCDGLLDSEILTHEIDRSDDANNVIRGIQTSASDRCSENLWSPAVADTQHCRAQEGDTLEGVAIPATLIEAMRETADGIARDEQGNMMIAFQEETRRYKESICWMYLRDDAIWVFGYETPTAGLPDEYPEDSTIEYNLYWQVKKAIETSREAKASSETTRRDIRSIMAFTESEEAMERAAAYLEEHAEGPVSRWGPTQHGGTGSSTNAIMDITLVPGLAAVKGLIRVEEVEKRWLNGPSGSRPNTTGNDAAATLRQTGGQYGIATAASPRHRSPLLQTDGGPR